jgi:hypothetical protein
MPLQLWASASEDLLATAGEAPALRLRIPAQVFVSTRDRLAGDSPEILGGVGARVSKSRRDARVQGNFLLPGNSSRPRSLEGTTPSKFILPAQTAIGEGSNGLGARAPDHRPADRS